MEKAEKMSKDAEFPFFSVIVSACEIAPLCAGFDEFAAQSDV